MNTPDDSTVSRLNCIPRGRAGVTDGKAAGMARRHYLGRCRGSG